MGCNRKTMVRILFLIVALALISISCTTQSPRKPHPDEVTLQLKYIHQAQFAGFYTAQEKGYYTGENIRVTLLEGGVDIDNTRRILSGEADFGVLAPEDILIKRSEGDGLTALAAIYQKSSVVFIAMEGSDIVRPADFIGKTVAVATGDGPFREAELQFYAIMNKLGLDISEITIIPWEADYAAFLQGKADVTPIYSTLGLVRFRRQGLKLNLIWPSDYGIHFYSDVLATTDSLIAENPDLVARFLRASLRGWQDAVEDYSGAVDMVLHYAPVQDRELQTAMLEAMLPMIYTGEDPLGWMEPAIWNGMYSILLEQGLLTAPFDIDRAYTMRFLKEIYRDGAE